MADIANITDYIGAGASPGDDLTILTLEQLRQQSKQTRWLVKHAIPTDSIGLLFGGSGTFKSFIALDLALHVAHGLPWLGKKTQQGKVLIVAAEGGSGVYKRIVAWHRSHRLQWAEAPVFVLPVAVDLGTDASRVQAAAASIDIKPDLIVIDTLSQTFSGEENSATEMAVYLREIGMWFRSVWQAAVLIVHHTGHLATERPRGTSALRANVDFMYGCHRDEKEMLATVENVKQKEGELLSPAIFTMKVVELGKDEDDDPITSLVATQMCNSDDVVGFMNYEAERGRGGRNHLFLELALNGVEEKKLRIIFCEAMDGDAETKRKAYFRAKRWAEAAHLVEFSKGFVIRLKSGA